MTLTVVGLGKIGLPLAVQAATRGIQVVGADTAPDVVDLVNEGRPPFPGEADLAGLLSAAVASGALSATTDTTAAVADSETVVVVVPLYVDDDGAPDFRAMDAATAAIAGGINPGTLVVYETTLPVGTTRTRFVPALEAGSGLALGASLFVAFSPERVSSGRVFADLRRYPKIVGGVDTPSATRAKEFYEVLLEFDDRPDLTRRNGVWDLGTSEAAEFAKLAETTYRDVNIGLANQFALFAERSGIDVRSVIEACNSQPFSHLHSPGIAVGGHCIPVYPRLYLWNDPAASVVSAARAANAAMPAEHVELLARLHGDLAGQVVAVLGAAYRGGVRETAFSGVFSVVRALADRGAVPVVHDPLYTAGELQQLGLEPMLDGMHVDAAVVQTDHAEYRGIGLEALPGVRTVVDGRAVLDAARWPGVVVAVLGSPGARWTATTGQQTP